MLDTFSISEAAVRTGMSVHALRYYERNGLLVTNVARNPSGHRRYSSDDLEWIQICRQLRRSGMSLTTLRHSTELVRSGPGNEKERLDLLRDQQARVLAEMHDLQASLDLISYKVDFYQQRVADGTAAATWAR